MLISQYTSAVCIGDASTTNAGASIRAGISMNDAEKLTPVKTYEVRCSIIVQKTRNYYQSWLQW